MENEKRKNIYRSIMLVIVVAIVTFVVTSIIRYDGSRKYLITAQGETDIRQQLESAITSISEILEDFDSPCLMVGIQGQTKEMIRKDIEILTKYFDHGTINIYRNNSTPIKRDEELIKWFDEEYHDLKNNRKYDYLGIPTDFGVGD